MSAVTANIRTPGSFALPSPVSRLFVAPDADGRPCVWTEDEDRPEFPIALLRPIDIPAPGRDALWAHITKGLPRRHDSEPDASPHRGLAGHANARKRADS